MPRGPQGQKRPADTIGCAVMVAKIATGEIEEEVKQPVTVSVAALLVTGPAALLTTT